MSSYRGLKLNIPPCRKPCSKNNDSSSRVSTSLTIFRVFRVYLGFHLGLPYAAKIIETYCTGKRANCSGVKSIIIHNNLLFSIVFVKERHLKKYAFFGSPCPVLRLRRKHPIGFDLKPIALEY